MKKFFTRFAMIVLFASVFATLSVAKAAPPPPQPGTLPDEVESVWPGQLTKDQALPGNGNVFTLVFNKDLDPANPLVGAGVVGLFKGVPLHGYTQVEVLHFDNLPQNSVEVVLPRTLKIKFDYLLEESSYHNDKWYAITMNAGSVRFADGTVLSEAIQKPTNNLDARWNFAIKDVTAPEVLVPDPVAPPTDPCSANDVNGQFGVKVNQNPIAFCFTEPVVWKNNLIDDNTGEFSPRRLSMGAIAFYLATKDGLQPNGEYGGDVIYSTVDSVKTYLNNVEVTTGEFDRIEMTPKKRLKAAAIGAHRWPKDRDIYMRFAKGLVEDVAGNDFNGIDGSPADTYTVEPTKYWFSTRSNDVIPGELFALQGTDCENAAQRIGLLWETDYLKVTFNSAYLVFDDNLKDISVAEMNAHNGFITVTVGGVTNTCSIENFEVDETANTTSFCLNPNGGKWAEKSTINVTVDGSLLHNENTLADVGVLSATFTTGDFTPPTAEVTIFNELCTNFQVRANDVSENARLYYAIRELDGTEWSDSYIPTAEEIIDGEVSVGNSSYYFDHVEDGLPYGHNNNTGFEADFFELTQNITLEELVDDFTDPHNGKQYELYYFLLDPNAQGPYHGISEIPNGRISSVKKLTVTLTDCLTPDLVWRYEQDSNPITFPKCNDGNNTIKKQGKFRLVFDSSSLEEALQLVDSSESLMDIVTLETATSTTFTSADIKTVTWIVSGGKNVGIEVTPKNSYPSGGKAKVTLLASKLQDLFGNAINYSIECEKNVVTYDDPRIGYFAVESKSLKFPNEYPLLNGKAATKQGTITIRFNNPMYSIASHETTPNTLLPISEDPEAPNYIGKYIKVREGDTDATHIGATITSTVVSDLEIPRTYELARATEGDGRGVIEIRITPQVPYDSETWYYVEVEDQLLDINRVVLNTVHNNNYQDQPHELYTTTQNKSNYFLQFFTEDYIAPELRFIFEKITGNYTGGMTGDRETPYITPINEDLVDCVDYLGFTQSPTVGAAHNGVPVGAIITEWSEMGFDHSPDYYVNEDPNGLRPYFTLQDAAGNNLDFDVVVLHIYTPDNTVFPATMVSGFEKYYKDAVWFGLRPFEQLSQGEQYKVTFNPNYQAEGSALSEGPVFVDDNNNAVVADTVVTFGTCLPETVLPSCLPLTVTSDAGTDGCSGAISPTFTIAFEDGHIINSSNVVTPTMTLQATGMPALTVTDTSSFAWNEGGKSVTVPFEAFGGSLSESTTYTLTVNGGVFSINGGTTTNCATTLTFKTPDVTAPEVLGYLPDIMQLAGGTVVTATDSYPVGMTATEISPYNPGNLVIAWKEPVSLVPGKIIEVRNSSDLTTLLIYKVQADGTTIKLDPGTIDPAIADSVEPGKFMEITYPTSGASVNALVIPLPKNVLEFTKEYHVDVEEGIVKDLCGNEAEVVPVGKAHTVTTWTFSTGDQLPVVLEDYTPSCNVQPGEEGTAFLSVSQSEVKEVTLTFDRTVEPVAGKKIIIENAPLAFQYDFEVTEMTSTDGITWKYTLPAPFAVNNGTAYTISANAGAFKSTYPVTSTVVWPVGSGTVTFTATASTCSSTFTVEDTVAPTVDIWPNDGDEHVPFNAYGYVRFSEKMQATANDGTAIVIDNEVMKHFISVIKYDENGNTEDYTLTDDEYVVEYVDLDINADRTHYVITFLDEKAPSIEGVTAGLQDEWRYKIVVNSTATFDVGAGMTAYTLTDLTGSIATNALPTTQHSFWTEDITAPKFYAKNCGLTSNSVSIRFLSVPREVQIHTTDGTNDYVRTYPAEAGKVYYKVLPAGSVVTAADLYASGTPSVELEAGVVKMVTATVSDVTGNYNYAVYAVMEDDETNVFVAADFGDAWVTKDEVFKVLPDSKPYTDPARGAIGIRDIRTAPNKSEDIYQWNFCFCDDDAPQVVGKTWDKSDNVPVNETFEITFDEQIAFGTDVVTSTGAGTGTLSGTVFTPHYGYEIRLREWDNNTSVDVDLAINDAGNGVIITPDAELKEETRYYIEIDRFAIHDVPCSSCMSYTNTTIPGPIAIQLDGTTSVCDSCDCSATTNFPGWVGRNEWKFRTTDNTPPVLTEVAPQGSCVSFDAHKITFTFTEKNGMVVRNLTEPENNIYIYTEGSTVAQEIIDASTYTITRVSNDVFEISYDVLETFNSEQEYRVIWSKKLFGDTATPTSHDYDVDPSLTAVYNSPEGAAWHEFKFTAEDTEKPVINWAILNGSYYKYTDCNGTLQTKPEYMFPLATGSYDPNNPSQTVADVCASKGELPTQLAYAVWFDEAIQEVPLTGSNTQKANWLKFHFKLTGSWTTPTSSTVDYDFKIIESRNDITGSSYTNTTIPVGKEYIIFTINKNSTTDFNGFDFLHKNAKVKFEVKSLSDNNAPGCRNNTVSNTPIFTFCTEDGTEAVPSFAIGNKEDGEKDILSQKSSEPDECILEKDYLRIRFSSPVVETGCNTVFPSDLFSWENLLNSEHFKLTGPVHVGPITGTNLGLIHFYKSGASMDSVVIREVEVVKPLQEYKLHFAEPLESEANYVLQLRAGKLKDTKRIPNGNILGSATRYFKVRDWEAPYITATTPVDGAVSVNPDKDLEITFNEDVELGTAARIIVRDKGTNGVVLNYRADDYRVTEAYGVVKVKTQGNLKNQTTYYVEIEPGFVYDANCGNLPFDGKFENGVVSDTWNFTTGDATPPQATLWPEPGTSCVGIDEPLIIEFDENIQLTDMGQLVIYQVVNGATATTTDPFGNVVEIIPFTTTNSPQVKVVGTDIANGFDRDKIIIYPSFDWEAGSTYYIRIVGEGVATSTQASVVEDLSGNTWKYPVEAGQTLLPGIHHNQWYFDTGKNIEPVLVGTTPVQSTVGNVTTVSLDEAGKPEVTTDLTMTFQDNVLLGEGKIQVYEFITNPEGGSAAKQAHLWKEFDVTDPAVSVASNTVTVSGVELLDGIHWYYVLVTQGAITNDEECTLTGWRGISNPDVWFFKTEADLVTPTLVANVVTSTACSEMYEDPATVEFTLTFSEPVSVANGTGIVNITDAHGFVATATITADHINSNVVSLNVDDFSQPLADRGYYSLVVPQGSIHDTATISLAGTRDPFGRVPFNNENWFAGVTIPFNTGDFTAPEAVTFIPNIADDAEAEFLENNVTMTVVFSEGVQDGEGLMKVYNAATGSEVATFDAANDLDAGANTVTFAINLPDETQYYVLLDEGFVTDSVYKAPNCDGVRNSVAVTSDKAWTFGIDDNTWLAVDDDLTENADNLERTFEIVLEMNDNVTTVSSTLARLYKGATSSSTDEVVGAVTSATIDANNPKIIRLAITVVDDQSTYWLKLDEGFAYDDAHNPNPNEEDATGPYVVGDRTAPVLEASAPAGGAVLDTYIGVEVMADFFDDSELEVVKPIIITSADGTVTTWTPTLDTDDKASTMPPLWFGVNTVTIPQGAVKDIPNGNEFAGTTWTFTVSDTEAPNCMTVISPVDAEACVKKDIELTMEFCERLAKGDPTKKVKVYDMREVQGQLQINSLFYETEIKDEMIQNGTGLVRTSTITIPVRGLEDNTSYIVEIDEDAIRDEAGNAYIGIDDPVTWNFTTGDNTPPTVTLVPTGGTNLVNQISVQAVFSEPVVGALTDIIIDNAVTSTIEATTDPKVYLMTITADDLQTVTITVPTSITDVNCNYNPLAQEVSGTYVIGDNTPPTVAITAQPAETNNTENNFTVELTFSEEVSGVAGALASSTGLVTVTTTDNVVYTVQMQGVDYAQLNLILDKAMVKDVSLNQNVLVEGLDVAYIVGDHVSPTVVSVTPDHADAAKNEFTVDITFSEAVKGLETGLTVNGQPAEVTAQTGNTYTVKLQGADHETLVLAVSTDITDDSFNENTLVVSGPWTYVVGDNTPPVLTVIRDHANDTVNVFDVILQFNEAVAGVNSSTVSIEALSDNASIEVREITEGRSYQATISGADGDSIVMKVGNGIADLAGNLLADGEFIYTIGCNGDDPSVRTVELETTVGKQARLEDAHSGIDMLLDAGMHTIPYDKYRCSYTLNVNVVVKDAIAKIQGIGEISPVKGANAEVEGTITGIVAGQGFFVQDANAAYSGIYVAYPNTTGLTIGNGARVKGKVDEVNGVTTLVADEVENIAALVTIEPIVSEQPAELAKEMYESVLVQAKGVRAEAANDEGVWRVYEESDNEAFVNDWIYAYAPVAGHFYNVTGIINGKADNFYIEPRMENDVKDITETKAEELDAVKFVVYPNPFNENISIDNADKLSRVEIWNIVAQKVVEINNPQKTINTQNLISGVYTVRLFNENGILVKTEKLVKR